MHIKQLERNKNREWADLVTDYTGFLKTSDAAKE